MSTSILPVISTPADILKYQNELIRTHQFEPLGKMKLISIGPNDKCRPNSTWDPVMRKYGRMIQFRGSSLPIAQSLDRSMILVTGWLRDKDGKVKLPDIGMPDWKPRDFTPEEVTGVVKRPAEADQCPMIPQKLVDRTEGLWENSDFYVFSPVLSISFQPEQNGVMLGTFWAIDCKPNPADGTYPALMINWKTGETHFHGGLYSIVRATGEN